MATVVVRELCMHLLRDLSIGQNNASKKKKNPLSIV